MKMWEFAQAIQASETWLADLRRHPASAEAAEMLEEAGRQVQSALEELHVAREELLASNQRVEAQRQRYYDLFEFAPDGYIVTDAAGQIQEANRASAELLNVAHPFLVGKPLAVYVAPSDRRTFFSEFRAVLEGQHTAEREVCLHPRNAPPFPAAMTVAVIRDHGSRAIELRWLIRDCSQRRRAEEARRALDGLLQERATQHAVERQREEFLTDVVHDLRTPVTAIKVGVGLLAAREAEAISPGMGRLTRSIERSTDQLEKLITDLFDLTRLQAGHYRLHRRRCDLRLVAMRAAQIVEPLALGCGQRLLTDLPDEPATADVDAERMEQVLVNLLDNAHRHGRAGGWIRLSLATNGPDIEVTVADDGPGIAPDDHPTIFERFASSQSVQRQSAGGTGLGLAIARALVTRHGGRIGVESAVGEGTTFRVTVPACSSEGEDGLAPLQLDSHEERQP